MGGEMANIDNILGAGVGIIGAVMVYNFATHATKQIQKQTKPLQKQIKPRKSDKKQLDYGGKLFSIKAWQP